MLERELGPAERADAVSAMEAAYAEAGVGRFAAWVHESDQAMRRELERRGYRLDESTRAMGMALEDVLLPRPQLDATPLGWPDSLRLFGLPPGLLASADLSAFRIVAVRIDGEHVAAAMTFDHGDDRGMYNVGTLERAGGAGSARR